MQFKFDAAQEYQIKAIQSIVHLFHGQGKMDAAIHYTTGAGVLVSLNRLDLSEKHLLKNLQEIQSSNGLAVSTELGFIEKEIDTAEGKRNARFPNFSIEMETGTGKTYVYIRTALELNKHYGFKRFIIVVPSIAVKEGVLKTFEITRKHFQEIYDNLPYKFYSYDSTNLTQVRQFASSSNLEFMVMTLDSFNKAVTEEGKGNVIRRSTDRLSGAIPIHLIQASKPIIILDEPQNMESERSVEALAALDPLLALRYSATHRNPYNLVYRLTPANAYRQGLVKKIEVASVFQENDINQVFIRADGILTRKNTVSATLTVNKLMKNGAVKQVSIKIRPSDNLMRKTNLPDYESFVVEEINPSSKTILFENGFELQVGESRGLNKQAIFEAQIRYTIEEHFRKQRRLRHHGIKVLSLFFIDRVNNYTPENGVIRKAFVKAFNDLKQKYPEWKNRSANEVQISYFALTKRKDNLDYHDSTGESKKDEEAYDLIMKDKELLLSFNEKSAFIFSHSALREGWDNPNVFQICTLNQTVSNIKKRQEVGRGVRLAVDQNGNRVFDSQVNLLTVIANQSYDEYVRQLQQEFVYEYGEDMELPPKPTNFRHRTTVTLRKKFILKPEFKELWKRIRSKTRYSVIIDTNKLVRETVKVIDTVGIKPPRVAITKARLDINDENAFEAIQLSAAKTLVDLSGRYPLPNLADIIVHLLESTTPPVRLSRRTLVKIFSLTKNKKAALDNPFEFASTVAYILKDKLLEHLINGIKYEKINEWYEMKRLETSFERWEDYVIPSARSVYDKVEYDSDLEKRFIEDLEHKYKDQVRMYIKLPPWFTVPTPVGEYNPDWAIVWEDRDEHGKPKRKPLLYLVRETKSTTERAKLRSHELQKITCGGKHFGDALGVDYKVITSASQLP